MTDDTKFSEKAPRAVAAEAMTYKRPEAAISHETGFISVTSDQVKQANDKRDALFDNAKALFARRS